MIMNSNCYDIELLCTYYTSNGYRFLLESDWSSINQVEKMKEMEGPGKEGEKDEVGHWTGNSATTFRLSDG
jgi:hypothetical protein